ncbi:uncharacterized protein DEA37_0015194 [Paragonimus westermani]|uniref:Uncharacterized protein n=1 Tax=Paragonimus westermani TaxID=34504 RepID=A0A5J4P1I3_9TREM|nr:uncharacterized protein DEA37_0015194 [Paragonimus westermani]
MNSDKNFVDTKSFTSDSGNKREEISRMCQKKLSATVIYEGTTSIVIHSTTTIMEKGGPKRTDRTELIAETSEKPAIKRLSEQEAIEEGKIDVSVDLQTPNLFSAETDGFKQAETKPPLPNRTTGKELGKTKLGEQESNSEGSHHTLPSADRCSSSAESTQSTGVAKNVKSKSSRVVISPNAVFSLGRERHSKTNVSIRERRPSIEWNEQVSINTPARRSSEHEVGWIDSKDIEASAETSGSDEEEDDVDFKQKQRPSIVVNMDGCGGRKISFALDKLDTEIKEYLAEIRNESESLVQSDK